MPCMRPGSISASGSLILCCGMSGKGEVIGGEAGIEIEILTAQVEDKSVLRHLLELCLHDYSEFNGKDVNEHGLFDYPYLDY